MLRKGDLTLGVLPLALAWAAEIPKVLRAESSAGRDPQRPSRPA